MNWNWFRNVANVTLVLVTLALIGVTLLLLSGYAIRGLIERDGTSVIATKDDLDAFETDTNDRFGKLTDATTKLTEAVSASLKKNDTSIDELTSAIGKMDGDMQQEQTIRQTILRSDTLTRRVSALEAQLKVQKESSPPPESIPVVPPIETSEKRQPSSLYDTVQGPDLSIIKNKEESSATTRSVGPWKITTFEKGENSPVFEGEDLSKGRIALNLTAPIKAHVWYNDGYLLGYKWNREIDVPVGGIDLHGAAAAVFYTENEPFEIWERDK
jgi:hypothetical protein